MSEGQTVLAQLMQHLPWTTFRRIVKRYGGDGSGRGMRCSEQFRAFAFAQVSARESLRDRDSPLFAPDSSTIDGLPRAGLNRHRAAVADEITALVARITAL